MDVGFKNVTVTCVSADLHAAECPSGPGRSGDLDTAEPDQHRGRSWRGAESLYPVEREGAGQPAPARLSTTDTVSEHTL